MCHVATGAVRAVTGTASNVTPGQPALTPNGRAVVYTGWSNVPVKRGMIYCFQRPCALYVAPIDDAWKEFESYLTSGAEVPFDVFKKHWGDSEPVNSPGKPQ